MTRLLLRFATDDEAQDLAEYGIALAVIGILAAAVAIVIAGDVGTLWSQAQSVIQSATSTVQS
jgi:Flp pilus assembly pilin Flp